MNLRTAIVITISVLFCMFFPTILNAQDKQNKWWNDAWQFRRKVKVVKTGKEDTDIAWTVFHIGDDIKEDGSDIRVVNTAGNVVESYVVFAEPTGRCEVLFSTKGTAGTFYIYYGNKQAGTSPAVLSLERGLILETRERPQGQSNSWEDYQKLLKNSRKIYGRGIRKNVFDGYNPYGPSDFYMSIYKGFISVPQDGVYKFATNSDDSSFLFVDGKKIAEWPGGHGATAVYGEHSGEISLKKGLHKFEYYHEEGAGGQACVAGWWTPGSKAVKLIPEDAFPGFITAAVSNPEKKDLSPSCEFIPRQMTDLELPSTDLIMCEYSFKERSYPADKIVSYMWDFGDGISSRESEPVHIYLLPGEYSITLTITTTDGKQDFTTRKIYSGISFFGPVSEVERLSRYSDVVSGYDYTRLSTNQLKAAKKLFEFTEKTDETLKITETLLSRKSELPAREYYELALELCDNYIKTQKEIQKAENILQEIIDTASQTRWVVRARIAAADIIFHIEKNHEKAIEAYDNIIKDYKEESWSYTRLAYIRKGDVYRESCDYNNSLEAYMSAQKIKQSSEELDDNIIRANLVMQIESLIKEKEFDEALLKLELWDWEFPQDKLSGYSPLLRAKVYTGKNNHEDAVTELSVYINVNKNTDISAQSSLLAEAQFMIGSSTYMKQEKFKEAAEAFALVIENYPESPLKEQAEKLRTNCEKKLK
ncbi:MAG: PKD domain-containing protein [Planctomycetota bacterium]